MKEQKSINQELADKIQQLEFDKAMLEKENKNLSSRVIDFNGLLDQSDLQAQLKFRNAEVADYQKKLTEEREKSSEQV